MIYDGLQQVFSRANVNQKVILLGDFNANINPMNGASDEAIVGPYSYWKRPTNEDGLWFLDLCGHFGLVLTNTLNNIKTKDIFTYKDKGPHGVWRLIDYVAIGRRHLYTLCQSSVLRGGTEALSLCRSPPCQEHTDALGRSTSEEGAKRSQKC